MNEEKEERGFMEGGGIA